MLKTLRQKLLSFLAQGITPQKLAQTCAIGLFIGTIPLLGTTTLLCTLISLRMKLNMAVIQAVNYVLYPLQLLLFIPFIKMGTLIFGGGKFDYTLAQIRTMIASGLWLAIKTLVYANMLGVLVWAIVMSGISWLVYRGSLPAFRKMARTGASANQPADRT